MHWLPNSSWAMVGICCLASGCAMVKGLPTKDHVRVAAATTTAPAAPAAGQVRAIEVDRGTESGQTMWQIQPAVSLVPSTSAAACQTGSIPPHIASRLEYAFDLAQRGAIYSAYGEFEAVLRLCAADVDAAGGGSARRTAVDDGLVALEEVEHYSAPTHSVAA